MGMTQPYGHDATLTHFIYWRLLQGPRWSYNRWGPAGTDWWSAGHSGNPADRLELGSQAGLAILHPSLNPAIGQAWQSDIQA